MIISSGIQRPGARKLTLCKEEMAYAAEVGSRMFHQSQSRNLDSRDYVTSTGNGILANNIASMQGEYAFSISMFEEWPALVNAAHHLPDVLPDWQVRWTSVMSGRLVVRPRDVPNKHQRFALVVGTPPEFHAVGWLWGHEAFAMDEYKTNPGGREPCWMIPQQRLRDLVVTSEYYRSLRSEAARRVGVGPAGDIG